MHCDVVRSPGGTVAIWRRDRFARPERSEVLTGAFPGVPPKELRQTSFAWTPSNQLAFRADSWRGTSAFEYDGRGHLVRETDGRGAVELRESDAVSKVRRGSKIPKCK